MHVCSHMHARSRQARHPWNALALRPFWMLLSEHLDSAGTGHDAPAVAARQRSPQMSG